MGTAYGPIYLDKNSNENDIFINSNAFFWMRKEWYLHLKHWIMARIVFWELHDAYRTQLKYLTGDIQKVYKEGFMNYTAWVEKGFGYLE